MNDCERLRDIFGPEIRRCCEVCHSDERLAHAIVDQVEMLVCCSALDDLVLLGLAEEDVSQDFREEILSRWGEELD